MKSAKYALFCFLHVVNESLTLKPECSLMNGFHLQIINIIPIQRYSVSNLYPNQLKYSAFIAMCGTLHLIDLSATDDHSFHR